MKKFLLVFILFPSLAWAQLVMPYTGATSTVPLPATYWVVAQTNLNDLAQTGNVTLFGYNSQADYQAGEQIIGSHTLKITPALYQQYYLGAVDHIASGYAAAQAAQDVLVSPAQGDIPAVYKSFFLGAAAASQNIIAPAR